MNALTLTKKNIRGIREAARLIGTDEKEILERAVLFYLASIKATLDLEKELRAWDTLSDEALARTDRSLKSRS